MLVYYHLKKLPSASKCGDYGTLLEYHLLIHHICTFQSPLAFGDSFIFTRAEYEYLS